jgi:hypothetical protein
MVKRIVELIRRKKRARLERRQLLKATGELPRGWLSRLVYKIKAKNHERLAQHRLQKQLLASLAANDTAVLESLVFLLETVRQEQRVRSEAHEALVKQLGGLEDQVDAGLRLVHSRIKAMEARLLAASRGSDAGVTEVAVAAIRTSGAGAGVNGELKHALAGQDRAAERVEPAVGARIEIGDPRGHRS